MNMSPLPRNDSTTIDPVFLIHLVDIRFWNQQLLHMKK